MGQSPQCRNVYKGINLEAFMSPSNIWTTKVCCVASQLTGASKDQLLALRTGQNN